MPPLPLFFDRAEGAHLWDVDGSRSVDHRLGMGPIFLCHNVEGPLREAARSLRRGVFSGGQSQAEVA